MAQRVFGPSKIRVLPHKELGPVTFITLKLKSTEKLEEGRVTCPNIGVRSKTLQIVQICFKNFELSLFFLFSYTFLQGIPCHMQQVEYIQPEDHILPNYKMHSLHPCKFPN